MPARKTDWKALHRLLQDIPPIPGASTTPVDTPGRDSPGKEILKKGRTTSIGNDGAFPAARTLDDRLRMMEANRAMYQQMRSLKKKALDTRSIHDRLKGLFGGGG